MHISAYIVNTLATTCWQQS